MLVHDSAVEEKNVIFMSTTILQDVSKKQNGTFNSVNCLFLILTTFYLIQLFYIPTSGESASTLWAVTKKLMASGICRTAPGFNLTSLITSFLKVSEVFNLPRNKQWYNIHVLHSNQNNTVNHFLFVCEKFSARFGRATYIFRIFLAANQS